MESSQRGRDICKSSSGVFLRRWQCCSKTVTMADFIRAMSTIEAEQERCVAIGPVPKGFYDGTLIQNKEQSFDVLITVSEHLGVIYLFGVPKQVVFPDLVFLFQVREGKLSTSFCFALKQDASGMIGPASRLCYYPFGNVYDDGKICWGNTVFPKVATIKDTEKLIQAFLMLKPIMICIITVSRTIRNLENNPDFWKHLRKWRCFRRNG